MSGHSKWSTIKHAKGIADAKRGALFTKFIKEISIAAKMGGGDPDSNPRLRTAMLKAKAASMPKDNIERAIKKGTGELGAVSYEELVYEGYAPGGVAVLVDVLTDNKNRAAADVRNIFNKNGGNLGTTGSTSRMFERKGVIEYDAEKVSEDDVMSVAVEAGAEDVVNEDGVITVTGSFCKNVEVNMKKVSKRTVTSLIAVMSMRASFFLILTLPIFYFLNKIF